MYLSKWGLQEHMSILMSYEENQAPKLTRCTILRKVCSFLTSTHNEKSPQRCDGGGLANLSSTTPCVSRNWQAENAYVGQVLQFDSVPVIDMVYSNCHLFMYPVVHGDLLSICPSICPRGSYPDLHLYCLLEF